jgi:hypothetical protein
LLHLVFYPDRTICQSLRVKSAPINAGILQVQAAANRLDMNLLFVGQAATQLLDTI